MSGNSNSAVMRLVDRIFPRMPDFYSLINEQCDLMVKAMDLFVEFMQDGTKEKGAEIRALEKQGDVLKQRNMDTLNSAFATPMDREDIFNAIISIDMVINYAKTTTRELEILNIEPDDYMREIVGYMKQGAEALQRGYGKLSTHPLQAEADAQEARKAERNTEKAYRRAVGELFEADSLVKGLEQKEAGAEAQAMLAVVDMFKRREVYRHLSNAADWIASASERLHDIIVKIA